MKHVLIIAATLLVTISTTAQIRQRSQTQQKTLTARQIAQRSFPSVVVLVSEDAKGKPSALGSGFFVSDDVIATNFHVVKGASRVYAKIVGQRAIYNILGTVAIDENQDLALLKVQGVKAQPLILGNASQIGVGDEIYVVGNPEGLEGTFSQGIISALRENGFIQITAPISHGSSGGPVLNNKGEVIGVAVGIREEGQNLNFSVPVTYLKLLISQIASVVPFKGKETKSDDPISGEWVGYSLLKARHKSADGTTWTVMGPVTKCTFNLQLKLDGETISGEQQMLCGENRVFKVEGTWTNNKLKLTFYRLNPESRVTEPSSTAVLSIVGDKLAGEDIQVDGMLAHDIFAFKKE